MAFYNCTYNRYIKISEVWPPPPLLRNYAKCLYNKICQAKSIVMKFYDHEVYI